MRQIKLIIFGIASAVFVSLTISANNKIGIKNIPSLCRMLPIETSIDSAIYRIWKSNHKKSIDLSRDFVSKYLLNVNNMVDYSFETGVLGNSYKAYYTYENSSGRFLLYAAIGRFGYTVYLADVTDIGEGRYPVTLAVHRDLAGQTKIWSEYDSVSNIISIHNQNLCIDFIDIEEGQAAIEEQTQSYHLSSGLKYDISVGNHYLYIVPFGYKPFEMIPDIKSVSISYRSCTMLEYFEEGEPIITQEELDSCESVLKQYGNFSK